MKRRFLLQFLTAGWLVAGNSFAKEPFPAKTKSAQPVVSSVAGKSVEEITALARPSVVIISHFGRDGAVDGVGSGFVVSAGGLIATSLHVIGEGRPIAVQLADGRKFEVTEVHAWDRKLDLAVIRIAATNLPALPLGDSDELRQGAPVVAIGNPRGLEHSVVSGVVSAKRQFEYAEMIQLAIPVEPGNSGGPLLDMRGRVHGLMTLKSAVTENLGFAMPVNALKPLLEKPNPVPMSRWLTLGALNPKEWTTLFGGRWSQKAGRILVDGPGTGFGGRTLCLSARELPERPCEIAVTVRLDDEAGAAGLVFGSDGADRHFGFYPSAGQLRLTRFDGPNVFSWTVLKQAGSAEYHPGDWNTLKVRFLPEKILCYVNEELVAETAADELPGVKVGLAKFRETRAEFKNFQVGKNLASSAPSAELATSIGQLIQELPESGRVDGRLVEALQPRAAASQAILEAHARKLEREAGRLRKLAQAVHERQVRDELVKLLNRPEDEIDLAHAALLVARLDNPGLDVAAYRRQLDQMGRELAAHLPADAGAAQRLAALTDYLFAENGFHGSRTDYYNRANSYLNEVMDDREGLPITLSILFMELAHRIGLEQMDGLALPGHFIVRHTPKKGDAQFIDVFEGGRKLSLREAQEIAVLNSGVPVQADDFEPAGKRKIIVRLVRNLAGLARRGETDRMPLRYLDLIIALEPDAPGERRNRAALRLQAGDAAGAREDLRWLLENQPRGVDLERIEELLRSL